RPLTCPAGLADAGRGRRGPPPPSQPIRDRAFFSRHASRSTAHPAGEPVGTPRRTGNPVQPATRDRGAPSRAEVCHARFHWRVAGQGPTLTRRGVLRLTRQAQRLPPPFDPD